MKIKDYSKYQSDDVGDVVFVFSGCRRHEEEAKLAVLLGWPVKQEYGVVMMSGISGYLSDFPKIIKQKPNYFIFFQSKIKTKSGAAVSPWIPHNWPKLW